MHTLYFKKYIFERTIWGALVFNSAASGNAADISDCKNASPVGCAAVSPAFFCVFGIGIGLHKVGRRYSRAGEDDRDGAEYFYLALERSDVWLFFLCAGYVGSISQATGEKRRGDSRFVDLHSRTVRGSFFDPNLFVGNGLCSYVFSDTFDMVFAAVAVKYTV